MWRSVPGTTAFLALLTLAPGALAAPAGPQPQPAAQPPGFVAVPAAQSIPVLTPKQAQAAFERMAAQEDIAFTYPQDGCYSRAHLMCQRLRALGYLPGKVWAFAHGENLHARTINDPRGFIEWNWHVAPTLKVRTPAGPRDLVIDPSLCTRPVTPEEWRDLMKKSPTSPGPFICLTRLGEPPLTPRGVRSPGSGYWQGADPASSLDEHARDTMRRYQAAADSR
jgi:hypothetical protein